MPRKIDEATRSDIRLALAGGMELGAAAKKYGICRATARAILNDTRYMQMTPGEICRDYRAAKDKPAQIKILAELNLLTVTEVVRILAADPTSGYRKSAG